MRQGLKHLKRNTIRKAIGTVDRVAAKPGFSNECGCYRIVLLRDVKIAGETIDHQWVRIPAYIDLGWLRRGMEVRITGIFGAYTRRNGTKDVGMTLVTAITPTKGDKACS
jgi:hypothetical protein